jgi:hypothetical protein
MMSPVMGHRNAEGGLLDILLGEDTTVPTVRNFVCVCVFFLLTAGDATAFGSIYRGLTPLYLAETKKERDDVGNSYV